jgi:cysteine desulfuration protein SufE
MLLRVLSDRTPDEILAAELQFIDQIELREHLSPNRRNGLSNMIKKMKAFALAFQSYANRA